MDKVETGAFNFLVLFELYYSYFYMMKLLLNYSVYLQEARRLFQEPEIADPETIDVRSRLHCYSWFTREASCHNI